MGLGARRGEVVAVADARCFGEVVGLGGVAAAVAGGGEG